MSATSLHTSPILLSSMSTATVGHTLPEMLAIVPHLLQTCVPSFITLRLVSKEISVTIMSTVTEFYLQLGDDAPPAPRGLENMFKLSKLNILIITFNTTSGGPTPEEQLATYTTQVAEIVHSMRAAIQNVEHLSLMFYHDQFMSSSSSNPASNRISIPRMNLPADGCPASFAVVTRTVCTMLASALPGLLALTVEGSCWDPAFAAFGAYCPRLRGLRVQAISLPIRELKGITTHLPGLEYFTLTQAKFFPTESQMNEYVEASLFALKSSMHLHTISLLLHFGVCLKFKPTTWNNLPRTLQKLQCSCTLRGINNAPALLSSLRYLSLWNTPRFEQVVQILRLAPHLQVFLSSDRSLLRQSNWWVPNQAVEPECFSGYTSRGPSCLVWCYREDILPGILLLQERQHNGLVMHFSGIHLFGSNTDMMAVLTALPELPHLTSTCALQFIGDPKPNCCVKAVRVFPHIRRLQLLSDSPQLVTPVIGTLMLQALAACTSLQVLQIRLQINHTTTSLLRLCLGIPALEVLQFVNSTGVSLPDLRSALAAHGRDVRIKELLM